MKRLILILAIFVLLFINVKAKHSDSIDVIHYTIALDFTDFANQTMKGFVELTIKSKISGLDYIALDLLDKVIDSVTVNDVRVYGVDYDDRTIKIPLPSPVQQGDSFLVAIYYYGQPVLDPSSWGGFYWTANGTFNLGVGFESIPHSFGRAWIPCVDEFVDRATFDFYITTNASLGHMAVCNGQLINFQDNCSGKRLCHWQMTSPIPVYLASFAVAPYVCVRDTFNGQLGPIPIELWVLPSDTLKAKNSFVNLKNILQLYESKFGPYRWQKVGYVSVDFNSGAMEHATNIAYPRAAINGNTTYETLYAHELFHHWFGDLITCSKAEEMWINEGWARFSEFLHDETFSGYSTYLTNKRSMLYNVLRYAHLEDSGFYALNNIPQFNTYGKSSYDKGALMVLNLRHFLGDSVFYNVMSSYLDQRAFQTVTSEDMRDFIASHTNTNVVDFFDTYIFTPGFPHFSVDSFKVEPLYNGNQVIVYSKEKLYGRTQYSNYTVSEVSLMDSQWNIRTYRIHLHNGYGVDTIQTDISPEIAIVDLYERINDASTGQYKVIKTTGTHTFDKTNFSALVQIANDSAFVRIENNWVAPDPFKTPIPGLILTTNHYWSVDGFLPQGFYAKGRFQYIMSTNPYSGGLDNDLLVNSIDSVVVVYRKNRSSDWQIIPSTRSGSAYTGYFIIDTLKTGEYAFAIWNWAAWNSLPYSNTNSNLKIYPNPNRGVFYINDNFSKNTLIEVYDLKGVLHYSSIIPTDTNQVEVNMTKSPDNIYILKIKKPNEKTQFSKLVIQK